MWTGGARVIIVNSEGKILLVRQNHEGRSIWMPPGGASEEGETTRDTAIREIMEETGLIVSIVRLLWTVEEVSEARGQRFVNFFLGTIIGGKEELGEDPELGENQVLEEMKFFSKEEFDSLELLYPDFLHEKIWEELADLDSNDPYIIRTNNYK